MVQWLRLHIPNTGVGRGWGWGCLGSIPGQGTRSHMLQLRPSIANKKVFFNNFFFFSDCLLYLGHCHFELSVLEAKVLGKKRTLLSGVLFLFCKYLSVLLPLGRSRSFLWTDSLEEDRALPASRGARCARQRVPTITSHIPSATGCFSFTVFC